jgi:hypothetical protein
VAHSRANIDHERTIQSDDDARRRDPHGTEPIAQADEDEPAAWPSSDRQKLETTANRTEQHEPEPPPGAEREAMLTHGVTKRVEPNSEGETPVDLPVPGYPYSEQALTAWFQQTKGREPSDREVGALMNAMAQRDATPPHQGPEPDPHGWATTPSAPPATRR